MAAPTLTLLGSFQARRESGQPLALPTRKGQVLLWGDSDDARARDTLRTTLAAFRKTLPGESPQILVAEGQTLALNPLVVEVDVAAFEQAVTTGTPETLERAAGLYQGDLLEGVSVSELAFEEWQTSTPMICCSMPSSSSTNAPRKAWPWRSTVFSECSPSTPPTLPPWPLRRLATRSVAIRGWRNTSRPKRGRESAWARAHSS